MELSEMNKKLMISCLGIVILTFTMCYIHKPYPLREGYPPFTDPSEIALGTAGGNSMSSIPIAFMNQALNLAKQTAIYGAQKAQSEARHIADTVDRNAKFISTKADAAAKYMSKEAADAARYAKKEASDIARNAQNKLTQKANAMKQEAAQIKREVQTNKKMGGIFSKMFKVGKRYLMYVGLIVAWVIGTTKCGLYWFLNFRKCFFWYILEVIGQILWLPFAFLIWIFPILKPPSDFFWNMLDQIDCLFFDTVGFHLIHYSENTIQQCYSCTPNSFPSFNITDFAQDLNPTALLKELVQIPPATSFLM